MKKRLLIFLVFVLCLGLPFGGTAFAYNNIVAFGDSLSDNGPADGYGFGVWSNGPVWVDYLADDLGAGLLDMAYGGATTYGHPAAANGYDYGLGWQVDQYINTPSLKSNPDDTLFTIWIGGNDFLDMTTSDTPATVIGTAVANIGTAITNLANDGAENILVVNMPDLGATPLMNGQNGLPDNSAGGRALSQGFNGALDYTLGLLDPMGINLMELDVFDLMDQFIAEGTFDDSTHMLVDAGTTSDSYLFYNEVHPTTDAHNLIALSAMNEVAPVPEPATIFLMGAGLLGLFGVNKKCRCQ